ncbi:hypothetical protein GQ53DRAFT_534153 [Thozetella sp. PMI_491]|nr:hypothetical protein GQ53DRAFT_534153 [Thozetella sp. PMI_491]
MNMPPFPLRYRDSPRSLISTWSSFSILSDAPLNFLLLPERTLRGAKVRRYAPTKSRLASAEKCITHLSSCRRTVILSPSTSVGSGRGGFDIVTASSSTPRVELLAVLCDTNSLTDGSDPLSDQLPRLHCICALTCGWAAVHCSVASSVETLKMRLCAHGLESRREDWARRLRERRAAGTGF